MNQQRHTLIRIMIGVIVYLFVFTTMSDYPSLMRIIVFAIIYFPAIYFYGKFTKNK